MTELKLSECERREKRVNRKEGQRAALKRENLEISTRYRLEQEDTFRQIFYSNPQLITINAFC